MFCRESQNNLTGAQEQMLTRPLYVVLNLSHQINLSDDLNSYTTVIVITRDLS